MAQPAAFFRSVHFAAFVLCMAAFSAVVALRCAGALEWLELGAYDFLVSIQPRITDTPDIVLVEIGDMDIQNLGTWPITDENLSRILHILVRSGARAIGIDLFRDIPVPPGTADLEATFRGNRNIIVVQKFGVGGIDAPSSLKGTDQVAFNDILVDPGGTVRRGLLFLDDGRQVFSSFALRLALLYLGAQGIAPKPDPEFPDYLRLGRCTIRPFESGCGYVNADTRGYQFLLDFKEAPTSFPIISATELLSAETAPPVLAGKIVIIGISAQSVKDVFFAPYSRGLDPDAQVPGVVLHAHATNQLLRLALGQTSPIRTAGRAYEVLLICACCLAGGFFGLRSRSPVRLAALACGGPSMMVLLAYAAFLEGWWVPLVPPSAGFLGSAALVVAYTSKQERKQRNLLMKIFSSHVSPQVAELLWNQRQQLMDGARLKSRNVYATVLFADLRGFSSIAEKLDPMVLVDWLNSVMETLTRLVMEHGGMVDDYAGDGVKADFGLPLPRLNEEEIRTDAINSVRCALAMVRKMDELNDSWRSRGLPTVGLRVGICSGPVVAATIGSDRRVKFTSVGNVVNTASRLESYDKKNMPPCPTGTPCRILISQSTFQYIDGCFRVQKIGEAELAGQNQKTTIYSILGCIEAPADPT